MSGFWVVSSGQDAVRGRWGPPWACQLVHAEFTAVTVVIDLVALEPRTGPGYRCPSGVPFTVTIRLPEAMEPELRSALQSWAEAADILAVATGRGDGAVWLSLGTGEHDLVVELIGAR